MARKKRIHQPGKSYHVMLKGNNGKDIFFNDQNRIKFCMLLQEGIEKYDHKIHAFCLMSNHVHLLIEVNVISLSKIVQNVAFRYACYINKLQKRIGHLFQGRFKSIVLDDEAYFPRLVRYIHLNPVKAYLVNKPEKYLWSSHGTYLGLNQITWLTTTRALSKFRNSPNGCLNGFQEYVLAKIDDEETDKELFETGDRVTNLLTENDIRENIKSKNDTDHKSNNISLKSIVEKVSDSFNIDAEVFNTPSQNRKVSLARAIIAYIAINNGVSSIEEIAKLLNRDSSTISSLLERLRKKIWNDKDLKNFIEKCEFEISRLADLQA